MISELDRGITIPGVPGRSCEIKLMNTLGGFPPRMSRLPPIRNYSRFALMNERDAVSRSRYCNM
jgi:hypothetical protein